MNRTLENAKVREKIIRFAKKLDIEPRTARRWWERSQKEKEVPCKLLENNAGRKSSFTLEHKEYIQNLLDEDPQLCTEDIIDSLPKHFMGLSIYKTQLNHRFEVVATQKKKVNRSKERAVDELNREKPIITLILKRKMLRITPRLQSKVQQL